MKKDEIIKKRFQDLISRVTDLDAGIESEFDSDIGKYISRMDSDSFVGWVINCLNLLERVLGKESIYFQEFNNAFRNKRDVVALGECSAILRAAYEDFEGGFLFNIQDLIRAEDFEDILDQSRQLLDTGYKDAACVVAGVALESTVKQLCLRLIYQMPNSTK